MPYQVADLDSKRGIFSAIVAWESDAKPGFRSYHAPIGNQPLAMSKLWLM
jgi:hypothetical protein